MPAQRMSESDSDSISEATVKERTRSRKSLLQSTDSGELKRRNSNTTKKSHALIERLNKIKTPSDKPRILTRDEVLEKELGELKEQMKENKESLARLEARLEQKEGVKQVDESCCIGYCTIS